MFRLSFSTKSLETLFDQISGIGSVGKPEPHSSPRSGDVQPAGRGRVLRSCAICVLPSPFMVTGRNASAPERAKDHGHDATSLAGQIGNLSVVF